MLPRIVAICGPKGAGKDALADHLVSVYGYEKIKFADVLKDAVGILFGFTREQMDDGDLKEVVDIRWGVTPRKVLQFFGTEVMQYKLQELMPNMDRKFLAYSLVNRISPDKKYVISDMRFRHEYQEIARIGAFVIKIDRPEHLRTFFGDTHISELEYIDIPCDLHIVNDKQVVDMIIAFHRHFALV